MAMKARTCSFEDTVDIFQGPGWRHLKASIEKLRNNFAILCDSLEVIVNLENTKLIGTGRVEIPDTSKRILGKEQQFIAQFREKIEHIKYVVVDAGDVTPEYAKLYISLNDHLQTCIKTLCHELKEQLMLKTKSAQVVLTDNKKMMVEIQEKDRLLMSEQRRCETVNGEKNTLAARCKVLEKQIEEKNTKIQQLLKESTVALWKREKQKLIGNIYSRERDIEKQLQSTSTEADDTKNRLEQRIEDLQNKLRKEQVRTSTRATVTSQDGTLLRRNLFLKERLYVVAESEIRRQQQYYFGLLKGLQRDNEITRPAIKMAMAGAEDENQNSIGMLEKGPVQIFTERLNRIVNSVAEGTVSQVRTFLPSHYLGIDLPKNTPIKRFPEKSTSTADFVVKISPEEEANLERTDLGRYLVKWRLGDEEDQPTLGKLLRDIQKEHPKFVDEEGRLLIKDASKYFPNMAEEKINHYFNIFSMWDDNGDLSLDTTEILHNLPGLLGHLSTTEEVADAVREIDIDESGTIDFYEFLLLIKLLQDGGGKASFFQKNDFLKVSTQLTDTNSKICTIQ